MTWFICGPMTGLPDYNKKAFLGAESFLQKEYSEAIINPIRNFAGDTNRSWVEYLDLTLEQINSCSDILLLDNWEFSRGCCLEVLKGLRYGKEFWLTDGSSLMRQDEGHLRALARSWTPEKHKEFLHLATPDEQAEKMDAKIGKNLYKHDDPSYYFDTNDHSIKECKALSEAQKRKQRPVFSGVLKYFPDAILEVAHCSFIGNEQHNPGTPLHWDRDKSKDELDALTRHLVQAGTVDSDGVRHSAKVAWRALANLQKEIESEA